ncbi:hypothetical protein [Tardiphaga sp. 803_E3_N1_3]|uniref:hypothetical protein n=1 Tax=Tardiphaga sp. 803_E3_N1_3 TaxID=3240785 RepID=UPI003F203935
MEIVIGDVIAVVITYLVVNGRRNADPLNRKSAAVICEYLAANPHLEPEPIHEMFMRNARYQKQALHIVSMVPALLIKAGYPKQPAMAVAPFLRAVALSVPR